MNSISVILDVDKSPPLKGRPADQTHRVSEGISITRIPGGMASGRSAVAVTAVLPDGKAVMLEMSMANFLAAAQAFKTVEEAGQVGNN